MEREKSAQAMWKKYFQMQCFYVIYAFYLLYLTLSTITFETYSSIDLKTKALLHCLHFMKMFKISNLVTKMLFFSENNSSENKSLKNFSRKKVGVGAFIRGPKSTQEGRRGSTLTCAYFCVEKARASTHNP